MVVSRSALSAIIHERQKSFAVKNLLYRQLNTRRRLQLTFWKSVSQNEKQRGQSLRFCEAQPQKYVKRVTVTKIPFSKFVTYNLVFESIAITPTTLFFYSLLS